MKIWTKTKGWICNMNEFVILVIGILLGACIGTTILCCFQLNRINAYEAEIRKLKQQLHQEKAKNNN